MITHLSFDERFARSVSNEREISVRYLLCEAPEGRVPRKRYRTLISRTILTSRKTGRDRQSLFAAILIIAVPMTMVVASPSSAQKPYSQNFSNSVVAVSVEVANTVLQIAEPTVVDIHLDAPIGSKIEFPDFAQAFQAFELISTQQFDSIPLGDLSDRRRWTRRIQVESIRSGSVTVPAMEFSVVVPEDVVEARKVKTEPLTFSIASSLSDSVAITDFRDIQGSVAVTLPSESTSLPILPLVLVALAASILSIFAWQRYRGRTIKPIAEWVASETARIRRRGRDRVRSVNELQDDLMRVLRQYVTEHFGFDAKAMSGDEIIRTLHETTQLPPAVIDRLLPVLESANRVRFAGTGLETEDVSQLQRDCDLLDNFVHETGPVKSVSSQPSSRARTLDV